MPYYRKCPKSVRDMAQNLLSRFETHKPLLDAGVTIDFVFAFPDLDENGMALNDALKKGGVKCLGLAKVIPNDRRAKGESDAEIKLDAPHWDAIDQDEQEAILDHELHHLSPVQDGTNTEGNPIFKLDPNGRPKIKMRKHDAEFGWFKIIAERHGRYSIEQIQANWLMAENGQYFWPDIVNALKSNGSAKTSRTQKLELANKE